MPSSSLHPSSNADGSLAHPPTSLTSLLARLRDQGWSPAERARVYLEWRNLVRTSVVCGTPTELDERLAHVERVARQALSGLERPEDLQVDRWGLGAFQQTIQTAFVLQSVDDWHRQEPEHRAALMAPLWSSWLHELEPEGFGLQHYISGLAQPFHGSAELATLMGRAHGTLKDSNLYEADLERLMAQDGLDPSRLPPVPWTPSLPEARTALEQALQASGIRRLELPAVDAERPAILMGVALMLGALNDTFQTVFGAPLAWGHGLTLLLGVGRTSQGFCFSSGTTMFTAPQPTCSLTEIVAHETIHAMDSAMASAFGPADASMASEAWQRGTPADTQAPQTHPWVRLMDALHEEPALAPNDPVWAQAQAGLDARWASSGISMPQFHQIHRRWLAKQLPEAGFYTALVDLFQKAGVRHNSTFMAQLLAVECRLLQRAAPGQPVWQQASYEFDLLAPQHYIKNPLRRQTKRSLQKTIDARVYEAGYFKNPSEIAARTFQVLFPPSEPRQPFEARSLVYPDATQAARIRAAWTDFFHDPAVRLHFQDAARVGPSEVHWSEEALAPSPTVRPRLRF